ncbi:divalent-cation tolerance protein CutA [Aurantiacibacter poecillastricola]|uniref:divalent-cation tolerance protein CutA n=1 Tax=Aurantiacibacter poecillastricola TaxID=3064385 RepID=UPI00273DFE64|nr:divalent-cation tolerance protein CutA [Aurantiacibacter sp. 219JJ12-13]MDP5260534.1 divalent-cation tolerance protein CutA [Aurantiacibacter sp. 219JJ12-13]
MSEKAAEAALIWTPFATRDEAMAAASVLIEEKLVACANIVPEIVSIFRYEDAVQSETEVGVLFKTHADLLDAATERLAQLHPYDTPAICGWPASSAPPETRAWLAELLPS